jgi:hypothetical protein
MPWTDQNEVPNTLPTLQTAILLFLRMSPLGQATFSSVVVINEHSTLATYQTESHHSQAQKSIQELVSFPVSLLQKLQSSFQSSCGISPHFKPKSDVGPLFLQLWCFLRYITITNVTAHTCTLLSNHMCYGSTSNSKWLSIFYLLNPSRSCVTSLLVHKSFDHTMYLPELKPRILS